MRRLSALLLLLCAGLTSACNPFYSVEQSNVERGYRWIGRGNYDRAIDTFQRAVGDYPGSGLAHLGLADALFEAGRDIDAVEMYGKALPMLREQGNIAAADAATGRQTIGERSFSYQNQGLSFPHGVEAYLHYRRGIACEALAKKFPARLSEYRAAAIADYATASALAAGWSAPRTRLACVAAPATANCDR